MYVFSQKLNWKIPEWNNATWEKKQQKNPKTFQSFSLKKNQSAANTRIRLNHKIMQKGLYCIAIIPSLPLPRRGPMEATTFNSFGCFSWWFL